MSNWYILNKDNVPVRMEMLAANIWLMAENKKVALDKVNGKTISTVFLGLDPSYGDGPPMLFETMIFEAGEVVGEMDRYSTWDQAVDGHNAIVAKVKEDK